MGGYTSKCEKSQNHCTLVCTQLRIFRKEIKATLNQELMHVIII
jgi:hypothetical protein